MNEQVINNSRVIYNKCMECLAKPYISIGILLSSFIINILGLVFPIVLLQIYDRIIPNQAYYTLTLLVCGVLAALLLETLLRICRGMINAWADARFEHTESTKAYSHLMHVPINDYEKEGAGVQLERLNSLASLKDYYGGQALITALDVPFVVLFLLLFAYLGGNLIVVPLVLLAVIIVYSIYSGNRMREFLKRRSIVDDRRMNFIIEILGGIHTIKSHAMEQQMTRRYERLQKGGIKWNYQLSLLTSNTTAVMAFISQVTVVLVVAFGSIKVINGTFTVGGLAACTFLASRALQPINRVIGFWQRLHSIKMAKGRLESIHELPQEKILDNNEHEITGRIQLRNISYGFTDKNNIINDLNLEFKAGESVLITGKGLSGKSTLLSIIKGLVTPSSGEVLLDGIDISHETSQQIKDSIALIPQRGVLFEGTILENITMFRHGEYVKRAKRVAKLLQIDKVIYKFPKGYQTMIMGASCDVLSPGLKQKITIARALVDSPRVILFDEADTGVDAQSNLILYKLLEQLKGKCTIIIVSNNDYFKGVVDRELNFGQGNVVS